MTGYKFADVVLVPFPFTDQTTTKKRPAVIISSEAYHRERPDVVLMAVTSQPRGTGAFGEVEIKAWQSTGLLKPSVIKPVIATIEQRLVIKRLGQLAEQDQRSLAGALKGIIG